MILKKTITRSDVFVRPEIIEFSQQFNNQKLIEKALKESDADFLYTSTVRLFDEGKFDDCIDMFFKAIHARYDIEKPLQKRFIRKKLNLINELQAQNELLIARMLEQRKVLHKYANEYYLLGNECIVSYKDTRAALANFDKALNLDPTFLDAWVRKGVTLYDIGDYYEADICFNKALELSPLSFKALYNRGKNRIALDSCEQAITDLDRALSIEPKHAACHEYIAQAYTGIGNLDLAEKHAAIARKLRSEK